MRYGFYIILFILALPPKNFAQDKRILSLETTIIGVADGHFSYRNDGNILSEASRPMLHSQSNFYFRTPLGSKWLLNTGVSLSSIYGQFSYDEPDGFTNTFEYLRSDMSFKVGMDYRFTSADKKSFGLYGGIKLAILKRLNYTLTYDNPVFSEIVEDPIAFLVPSGQLDITGFFRFNDRLGMHLSLMYMVVPKLKRSDQFTFYMGYNSIASVVGIDYYL